MGNVVLNLSMAEINKMKSYYDGKLLDKFPPGSIFSAKTASCTITAYKSGKVLFQGNGNEAEASRWGGAGNVKAPAKSKLPSGNLPEGFSQLSVIGSDEVGTGDFFGPITVVAAYVQEGRYSIIERIRCQRFKGLKG